MRLISYWIQHEKKKAAKPLKQSVAKLRKTTATAKDSKLDRKKEDVQTVPIELVIVEKTAGRKKTVPAERSKEKQMMIDRQTQRNVSLIIENAILKERRALLNGEIEKLRTALTSLM